VLRTLFFLSIFPFSLACFSALKMTIKEVKKENGDKVIIPRKRKALKLGPIRKKNLKKLVLLLKNGADCPCHQLDNLGHHFLIMGRQVKPQHLLTAIYKWDKKNKEFKKPKELLKNNDLQMNELLLLKKIELLKLQLLPRNKITLANVF